MTQLEKFEEWFTQFKIDRILKKTIMGIDGRQLYGYQLTTPELDELKLLFRRYYRGLYPDNKKLNQLYGAAFVMLCSEFYRREYQREWKWEAINNFIGINTNNITERNQLITYGFEHWKLPTILGEQGKSRDFLGAVMIQGGLPWKLVQNDKDSFRKVIQHCFNHYVQIISNYGSLLPEIQKYAQIYNFPTYHANQTTFELMAGVVETVIDLQRRYPDLSVIADQTEYLNKYEPDWVYNFPIPIDEDNAQTLLKSWFNSAKEQVDKSLREQMNKENHFVVEHLWKAPLDITDELLTGFITNIIQPTLLTIPKSRLKSEPANLRIELLIYEGNAVLAKGKTFYADYDNENLTIKCRVDADSYAVHRRNLYESLTIKLMSAGSLIYEEVISQSALSEKNMPLFFIKNNGYYKCVADAGSYKTAHLHGYLYVPNELTILGQPSDEYEPNDYRIIYQGEKAAWLEIIDSIEVQGDENNDTFIYEANSKDPSKALYLKGEEETDVRGSRLIYRGFPILENAPNGVIEYVNGQKINGQLRREIVGNVNYQAKTADGQTLLMRRFAILPPKYSLVVQPLNLQDKELTTSVELEKFDMITGLVNFSIDSTSEAVSIHKIKPNTYEIHIIDIDNIPGSITAQIPSTHHVEPLMVYLVIPLIGIRVQKDHQYLARDEGLSLSMDELIGHDILLQSKNDIQNVYIELTLHSQRYHQTNMPLVMRNIFKPKAKYSRINLIGFRDEIQQLMSIMDDLDSYVMLKISSVGVGSITIKIHRFHIKGVVIQRDDEPNLSIKLSGIEEKNLSKVEFEWISLVDPGHIIVLDIHKTLPTNTDDIGIVFNNDVSKEALGLIVAKADSELTLRPILVVNQDYLEKASYERNTIEYAVIHFHPQSMNVFHNVFEEMANDLNHSGWLYYEKLMQNISDSILLSTFAAWKLLVTDQRLLTIAFFKLRFSTDFCIRMQNELSVIWEAISFEHWKNAWHTFVEPLSTNISDVTTLNIILVKLFNDAMDKISTIIPVKKTLIDYIHESPLKGLINDTTLDELLNSKRVLISHNTDNEWPIYLKDSLISWFNKVILAENLLSKDFIFVLFSSEDPKYRYSSLILPVYMAAISAGIAKFGDIRLYDESSQSMGVSGFEQLVELKFIYQQLSSFDHEWYNTCYYYALVEFLDWA